MNAEPAQRISGPNADEPPTSVGADSPNRQGLHRRSLALIFLVALAVRAAWGVLRILQAHDPTQLEFPDEQQYWLIAESLSGGSGLRDELGFRATRMPLYPAFLSAFTPLEHGVVAAKAAQGIIGALCAVLTAMLGAAVGGRRVGTIAGCLVAIDPFQIFFSSALLTETPFTAALLWHSLLLAPAVLAGQRAGPRRWMPIGLSAAICVYLRESSLGLVLLTTSFAALNRPLNRQSLLGASMAVVVVAAALLPWAIRNRSVVGEWVFLTTRSGISLYDGVGPQATGASDLGQIKNAPVVRGLSEAEWNRHFLMESYRAVQDNPGRIVRLALTKARRTWSPAANADDYQSPAVRLVGLAWSLPVYGLAGAGAVVCWRQGRRRLVFLLLLPAIYLTLLHMIFVGSVRYRLPAMPMLEVLGAACLASWSSRLRRHSIAIP